MTTGGELQVLVSTEALSHAAVAQGTPVAEQMDQADPSSPKGSPWDGCITHTHAHLGLWEEGEMVKPAWDIGQAKIMTVLYPLSVFPRTHREIGKVDKEEKEKCRDGSLSERNSHFAEQNDWRLGN